VEQPGFLGDPSSETETSFTFSKAAGSGTDGEYTFKIALADKAGNTATDLPGEGFSVDATVPVLTVTSLSAGPHRSPKNTETDVVAHVEFSASEELDPAKGQVKAVIGGQWTVNCPDGPAKTFDCTFTVPRDLQPGDPLERTKAVVLEATDAAGNTTTANAGTMSFDFTPPAVVNGSEGLQLIPATGNPLPTVRTVKYGTAARVSFTASEALSGDPVVALSPATGDWTMTKKNVAGSFYVYDAVLTGGWPDQIRYDVVVTLADLAGNVSERVALALPSAPNPSVTVDTVAPAVPDVVTLDKIVYTRIAWGSHVTVGVKTFSLRGGNGAVEANATVLVHDAADVERAAEIGRTTASFGGAFGGDIGSGNEFVLNRADRAAVYVTAVDLAGNQSDADPGTSGVQGVKVKDVEWVATLGFKVPASIFENPNLIASTPFFWPTLAQDPLASLEPSAAEFVKLQLVDSEAVLSAAEASWRQVATNSSSPSSGQGYAMAYDAARWKAVLFGGQETWEWDVQSGIWTDRTPAGVKPSAREGHAMVYDAARGKVVLFGGMYSSGFSPITLSDVWEWDGVDGTWTERWRSNDLSLSRYRHALAYDTARGTIVLFGGLNLYLQRLGDTWEWDGGLGTWTEKTPTGENPSARTGHALAYDAMQKKVILFGGEDGYLSSKQDTWEWDGALGTWTEKTPTGENPSARTGHALAHDVAQGKVILFGGYDGLPRQDMWEWDGALRTWTERMPTGGNPTPRAGHQIVYDAARRKVVMFGGTAAADAWEWDGAAGVWTERTPTGIRPSARDGHSLTYDSVRRKVVLFGGSSGGDETWEWDGTAGKWTERTPTGTKPAAREYHAMTYDAVRGKVILFGGYDGTWKQDIWEWEGNAGTWTDRTPAGAKPSARGWHGLACDAARGKVVLFGGYDGSYYQDTWEWDGNAGTWIDRTPAGANPPTTGALVYDPAREKVVLFAGGNWEWDGALGTWTKWVDEPCPPCDRTAYAVAFDALRGKAVLFGGQGEEDARFGDTWEWDGLSGIWTNETPTGVNPTARSDHALAFDAGRAKVVLFGGYGGSRRQDTWEWDGGASSRPAQLMQVLFVAAGISTTYVAKSISSTFHSGGVGYPSGVATNGVDLKVWDEGMWKVVATNNAPPDNPQLVSWTTTDPQVISRLFFGDQQTLNFAVTPVAPNGTGTGEISVDYA
jgi:hypothetical protein